MSDVHGDRGLERCDRPALRVNVVNSRERRLGRGQVGPRSALRRTCLRRSGGGHQPTSHGLALSERLDNGFPGVQVPGVNHVCKGSTYQDRRHAGLVGDVFGAGRPAVAGLRSKYADGVDGRFAALQVS